MTRMTFTALAALLLAAAPALAQSSPPKPGMQPAQQAAPTTPAPAPGSEEWLRPRAESYRAAPDSEQDPAEVAETIKLNAEIAARNAAAERAEAEAAAAFEAETARWREEAARIETQRAQWEADNAAAEAARAQWERDRAAWEAEVAACERAHRSGCRVAPAPKG